jgi:hypothetical protein
MLLALGFSSPPLIKAQTSAMPTAEDPTMNASMPMMIRDDKHAANARHMKRLERMS